VRLAVDGRTLGPPVGHDTALQHVEKILAAHGLFGASGEHAIVQILDGLSIGIIHIFFFV